MDKCQHLLDSWNIAAIVITLHIIDLYRGRERHIKAWLVTFLKHILDEHLAGEIYHTRISILRVERGYKVFFKSLFYFVFSNFCNNFKNATWRNSFKDIAVHIMSDYLTVYTKYSYPKAKNSHAYFRLSDNANRNQFNGIANKCLEEGVPQFVHTIDISGIDVTRPFDKLSSNEKNKVTEFEFDGFGYTARSNKNAINLLEIPEYEVMVVCKDDKYGFINKQGQIINEYGIAFDDIYMIRDGGVYKYRASFNGTEYEVEKLLADVDVKVNSPSPTQNVTTNVQEQQTTEEQQVDSNQQQPADAQQADPNQQQPAQEQQPSQEQQVDPNQQQSV